MNWKYSIEGTHLSFIKNSHKVYSSGQRQLKECKVASISHTLFHCEYDQVKYAQ